MCDNLPRSPRYNGSAIVNWDIISNPGTHWVAYMKRGNTVNNFDRFGNLKPPRGLAVYFGPKVKISQ